MTGTILPKEKNLMFFYEELKISLSQAMESAFVSFS